MPNTNWDKLPGGHDTLRWQAHRKPPGQAAAPAEPYVYLQDPDVTLYCGDVLDTLRQLPDESVHMACTSPPFYGLRDYGTGTWEGGDVGCDHAPPKQPARKFTNGRGEGQGDDYAGSNLKSWTDRDGTTYRDICGKCGARRVDQQIGLEATPDEWAARLVEVSRELRRVLRSDGTLWLEVGDSYNADGRKGRAHMGIGKNSGYSAWVNKTAEGTKPKDMIGAPWLLAFALRADGWYLRSEIIWAKPNPMPESVTDRPTVSHSRVFLLTKSARYFYDAEAIREQSITNDARRPYGSNGAWEMDGRNKWEQGAGQPRTTDASARNRRTVWTIATQPYPEAHFATWPERLVEPMILAGTSERGVCPECGAPWERTTEHEYEWYREPKERNFRETAGYMGKGGHANKRVTTTGWQPTCTCTMPAQHTVPAVVLDPFAGSGTSLHVARRLGRHAVGVELNPDYCALAARRLEQQSLFAEGATVAAAAPKSAPSTPDREEHETDPRSIP